MLAAQVVTRYRHWPLPSLPPPLFIADASGCDYVLKWSIKAVQQRRENTRGNSVLYYAKRNKRKGLSSSKICVLTYNIHKGYCTGNRRFVLIPCAIVSPNPAPTWYSCRKYTAPLSRAAKRRRFSYPDQPHFEYLADQSWPHYAYGRNSIYRKGDHGNAILSMYPFASWENIDVRFQTLQPQYPARHYRDPGRSVRLHTPVCPSRPAGAGARDQFQASPSALTSMCPTMNR